MKNIQNIVKASELKVGDICIDSSEKKIVISIEETKNLFTSHLIKFHDGSEWSFTPNQINDTPIWNVLDLFALVDSHQELSSKCSDYLSKYSELLLAVKSFNADLTQANKQLTEILQKEF